MHFNLRDLNICRRAYHLTEETVLFRTNLIELNYPLPYLEFQDYPSLGSGEKNFTFFTKYGHGSHDLVR